MVAKIRQQQILTDVFFPLTGRKVGCSDKRLLVARGKRGSRRPERKERSVTPHVLQADFWPASTGVVLAHTFRVARNSGIILWTVTFGELANDYIRVERRVVPQFEIFSSLTPA
jgi:hypothetical protein